MNHEREAFYETEPTNIYFKCVFAALPQTCTWKATRLSGDPSGDNMLYCNGSNVYIRNLLDPLQVKIFTGHTRTTTVARYSPSRMYIASADVTGRLIVWDAAGQKVRVEYQALGSVITDLDWSMDSHFIVVCGFGNDAYGRVLAVDNGELCGKIEGQSKMINTCSYRHRRPFAIVTASEDNTVAFHRGPPFSLRTVHKAHNNYAQVARFSKDGEIVVSGGADGKLLKYEGKPGQWTKVKEIGSPAHQGPIMELCFSPDSKHVMTVSGDGTARIFDVLAGTLIRELVTEDGMQGCLWQSGLLVTINRRGYITCHSASTDTTTPLTVIKGHVKGIKHMVVASTGDVLYTGNEEGIMRWGVENGVCEEVVSSKALLCLVDMAVDNSHLVYVTDGCWLVFLPLDNGDKETNSDCLQPLKEVLFKLPSRPNAVDALLGWVLVACASHVCVVNVEGEAMLHSVKVSSPANCITIHPAASSVATGHENGQLRVYWIPQGTLQERGNILMHTAISAIAYAPCGAYIAIGAEGRVSVLTATDYKELSRREAFTGRIVSIAWNPDSQRFVTAGLKGPVMIWDDVNDSYKKKAHIMAHPGTHANAVGWLDNNTVVTAGQDANIKQFNVTPFIKFQTSISTVTISSSISKKPSFSN